MGSSITHFQAGRRSGPEWFGAALALLPLLLSCTARPGDLRSLTATVSGLVGTGLVLQVNESSDILVEANGPVALVNAPDGAKYLVKVKRQPTGPDQTCTLTNESGTVDASGVSVQVTCQVPPLGLNASKLEWLDGKRIRATYDWSTAAQLEDWSPTSGATLQLGDGTLTIACEGGGDPIPGMRWKRPIAATRIAASANPIGDSGHLNIYTNLDASWDGEWLPTPAIGVVYAGHEEPNRCFWAVDGVEYGFPGATPQKDTWYEIELSITTTMIRTSSNSSSSFAPAPFERSGSYSPRKNGIVGLGAWGGSNAWKTIVIEGEVDFSIPNTP